MTIKKGMEEHSRLAVLIVVYVQLLEIMEG
jgi:hypothetical protein